MDADAVQDVNKVNGVEKNLPSKKTKALAKEKEKMSLWILKVTKTRNLISRPTRPRMNKITITRLTRLSDPGTYGISTILLNLSFLTK